MPGLSIIFCYRDKEVSRVKNALDSLSLQDNQDFQVLFVDYGSSEAFRQQIESLCSQYAFCTYLYIDSQGKYWNRAEALNYGILNCDSQWIFTADVDLVFKTNFVSQLYKEAKSSEAKFFAVGYLDEQRTKQLDLEQLDTLAHTKSEDFALGMVLASKATLAQVQGYNAFYAIWGMEDNDLQARLQQQGIKTSFIHDVYMLHQYHAPANTREGGMPLGWNQYAKDYFDANGEVIGLDKLKFPAERPAKAYKNDLGFVTKQLSGRLLFLRHQLLQYILDPKEKKLVLVIDTAIHNMPADSTTAGLIGLTNTAFRKLGVHAHVNSNFKEQYITAREIRDEVYFMVKSLHAYLADHFIEESGNTITLAIVKS